MRSTSHWPLADFVEVLSFPFASTTDLDLMGVPADDRRRRLNKIVNPLSEATPCAPRCCRAVRGRGQNRSRGNDDLALFEAGSVFFANDPLLAAPRPPVTQRPSAEGWLRWIVRSVSNLDTSERCSPVGGCWMAGRDQGSQQAGSSHRIRRGSRRCDRIAIGPPRAEYSPWHPGRCAQFTLPTGEAIGYAGELHPEVSVAFGYRLALLLRRSILMR